MNSSFTISRASLFTFAVLAVFGFAGDANGQQPSGFSLNRAAESRLSSVGPSVQPASHLAPTKLPPSLHNYRPQTEPTALAAGPSSGVESFMGIGSQVAVESQTGPEASAFGSRNDYYAPVASGTQPSQSFNDLLTDQAEQMITREGTGSSVKIAILLAALSLAPALILMTTCYVRVVVVLTLLRQAFGSQQLPSTQILTALSLFVTFLVMAPTWNEIKTEAIDPYTQPNSQMSFDTAFQKAIIPVKRFMARQIQLAHNEDSVAMFYRYMPRETGGEPSPPPTSIEQVPLNVLMPAFLVSELKVAFLLGFQVYLPFLIVDLVVSSVTVSMGMVMLPPTIVSFPLKLILFVMVDGWTLVVGMLMQSFGPL